MEAIPNSSYSVLSPLLRFYLYGVQGFCYEVIFTAFFDFFVHDAGWELKGHSSISSFFIYGICGFMIEHLYVFLYYKHGIQWYWREPIYLIIVYCWEFSTGLLLRQFNACPWDYSHYPYNLMGLITLLYAPGWLFLGLVQDAVADYLLRMRVVKSPFLDSMRRIQGTQQNGECTKLDW